MNHDTVEKKIGLMGVLIALVISIGGLAQIVPLYFQGVSKQPAPGVEPYDALRLAGRGARLTVADEGVRATMPDSRGLRGGGLFRRAQKGARGRRGWGCRRFRRARRRRSAARVPFARVRDGRRRGVAQSGSAAGWPRCGLCSASAGVPVFDRVRESAGAVSRARVPARARRDLRARPFCPSSFSWRLPVPPDRPWPRWQKLRAALFQ